MSSTHSALGIYEILEPILSAVACDIPELALFAVTYDSSDIYPKRNNEVLDLRRVCKRWNSVIMGSRIILSWLQPPLNHHYFSTVPPFVWFYDPKEEDVTALIATYRKKDGNVWCEGRASCLSLPLSWPHRSIRLRTTIKTGLANYTKEGCKTIGDAVEAIASHFRDIYDSSPRDCGKFGILFSLQWRRSHSWEIEAIIEKCLSSYDEWASSVGTSLGLINGNNIGATYPS